MNDVLKEFARQSLKDGLAQCTKDQQRRFKLMYGQPTEPRCRTPDVVSLIKGRDIKKVVDGMPEESLDWAMVQVQRTLAATPGTLDDHCSNCGEPVCL